MRLTKPADTAAIASRTRPADAWRPLVYLMLALGFASGASADTYTVGLGGGCSHASIATALTTAENHPGPDTIRITRSAGYIHQAINFTTSQELTITGGYADCVTNTEDMTNTKLDGAGGSLAPVMTILGNTGSLIRLRKLEITGGDVPTNGTAGGGISYTGNGLLDLANMSIHGNTGAYGGGINAGGLDNAAELDIGPNVNIRSNIALYNGGGLYNNNLETVIRGDDTSIFLNEAQGIDGVSGLGGGIDIRACAEDSIVYLSGGSLAVALNQASYGAGVAIETRSGCSKPAELRMFSTSTATTRIAGNQASVKGGGIYIYRAGGPAKVGVWNAAIEDNTAPIAAAMHLGDGGSAYFNELSSPAPPRPQGAADSAVGVPCGYIRGNVSSNGQVIYGADDNYLELHRVQMTGNQGTELVRLNKFDMYDSLIADNIASTGRLIETHVGRFYWSTIAGNQIAGSRVFGINTGGSFTLWDSIAYQSGKSVLNNDGGTPSVQDVVSNESATLGPNPLRVLVANPRFIDPLHGDYRLTAGSPAVDYIFGGSTIKDLLSLPRHIDLDLVADVTGPTDVGAYERQSLQPLVENGEFYGNAYVWAIPNAAVASYDASQNAPGSTGGSLHIKSTDLEVAGAMQCIHLPSPGVYSLNGSGKIITGSMINPHYASLGWELRLAGSESCLGNPDATGGKVLAATDSGAWNRPSTAATITVTPQQWTPATSVTVYAKLSEPINGKPNGSNSPSVGTLKEGWIDHVVLSVDGDDDIIFKNGFEQP